MAFIYTTFTTATFRNETRGFMVGGGYMRKAWEGHISPSRHLYFGGLWALHKKI